MANMFDELDGKDAPPKSAPTTVETPPGIPRITVTPATRGNMFDESTANVPPPKDPWATFRALQQGQAPHGYLQPADVTPTQQAKWALQDRYMAMGADAYNAGRLANITVDVPSALTPIGAGFSAADFAYHAPKVFTSERPMANLGAAALDAAGIVPGWNPIRNTLRDIATFGGARAARELPTIIPAHEPPAWARFDLSGRPYPPASVSGTPFEQMGWVTPSQVELSGRGRTPFDPLGPGAQTPRGTAQQGYDLIRSSPVRFDPSAADDIAHLAIQHIQNPQIGAFTAQKAPLVHDTLKTWQKQIADRGTPVTPSDLDVLRQSLRGLPDANGPAGNEAVKALDTYMAFPPPSRVVRGTPQDFADMRTNFAQARGDYRAGETARTVEEAIDRAGTRAGATYSGGNLENATRQNMAAFSNSAAGQERIFGATQPERLGIWQASQGTPLQNWERATGKLLGGGGGMHGFNVVAGTTTPIAAGLIYEGFDPYTAGAAGLGVGLTARGVGRVMNRAAAERAVNAAETAAADIRRNSPEYQRRLAEMGGAIPDPREEFRNRITMALTPGVREAATQQWFNQFAPYQDR